MFRCILDFCLSALAGLLGIFLAMGFPLFLILGFDIGLSYFTIGLSSSSVPAWFVAIILPSDLVLFGICVRFVWPIARRLEAYAEE